jgi:hypothetical protein
MQVDFWINEVRQGRTDLSMIASPGRDLDEILVASIARKLDTDPHLSLCAKAGVLLGHCTIHSLPILG